MLKDIAIKTFTGDGSGTVLIQMVLVALAGFLFRYIAIAAQQQQIANMIGATTIFICIAQVAATAFKALVAIAIALGL